MLEQLPLRYDNIDELENVLVYGTTGSGKSTFLHVLIKSVLNSNKPEEYKLLLVDPKQVEFHPYKHSKYLLSPIVDNPEDLLSKIIELFNECDKRRQNNTKSPHIFLVIDEFACVMNKDVNGALLHLIHNGAKYGIHVLLSTQRITDRVANIDFFKSFKTIICQMNHDEEETRLLIGEYVELETPGDSLIFLNGKLTRFKLPKDALPL